jgi:hypothetical protein
MKENIYYIKLLCPKGQSHCSVVGHKLFGGTNGMDPLKDLHTLDTCELSLSYLSYIYPFKKF